MSKALESLFAACEELEASDVHVMAGRKPCFRVRGALAPNGDFRELNAAETETLALELGRMTRASPARFARRGCDECGGSPIPFQRLPHVRHLCRRPAPARFALPHV